MRQKRLTDNFPLELWWMNNFPLQAQVHLSICHRLKLKSPLISSKNHCILPSSFFLLPSLKLGSIFKIKSLFKNFHLMKHNTSSWRAFKQYFSLIKSKHYQPCSIKLECAQVDKSTRKITKFSVNPLLSSSPIFWRVNKNRIDK